MSVQWLPQHAAAALAGTQATHPCSCTECTTLHARHALNPHVLLLLPPLCRLVNDILTEAQQERYSAFRRSTLKKPIQVRPRWLAGMNASWLVLGGHGMGRCAACPAPAAASLCAATRSVAVLRSLPHVCLVS